MAPLVALCQMSVFIQEETILIVCAVEGCIGHLHLKMLLDKIITANAELACGANAIHDDGVSRNVIVF